MNKKKQKNLALVALSIDPGGSALGLLSAGKRRFFEKKRAKNFIRLVASVGRRGRSLHIQGRAAPPESFFASFCSQKEDLAGFLSLGFDAATNA